MKNPTHAKSCIALPLIYTLVICSIFSCTKNDTPNVVPPPPEKTDTLTTGWTKIQAVPDSFSLIDIVFQDNSTGYILSLNHFSVYKTTNGGQTWSVLPGSFAEATNLFVTTDGKLFVPTQGNIIFRSIDGGQHFDAVIVPSTQINDVYFLDNTFGYATCVNGILQTGDGGATWTLTNPLAGLTMTNNLYSSLSFVNSATGWISTGSLLYKSNGNTNTWQKSNLSTTSGTAFSVFAVSASVIYAGNVDGKLFKSTNGGVDFNLIKTFPADKGGYLDVHFLDENLGYACYENKIYKTTDGGSTWQTVATLAKESLIEIHFTDANHGWASAQKGIILKFN